VRVPMAHGWWARTRERVRVHAARPKTRVRSCGRAARVASARAGLLVALEREMTAGRARATTVRFLVLQQLQGEPKPKPEPELELEPVLELELVLVLVSKRTRMQVVVVVVVMMVFGFEASRRGRRLEAYWGLRGGFFFFFYGFVSVFLFVCLFCSVDVGGAEGGEERGDVLDFGLEALLFFCRALDGAGEFRVGLCMHVCMYAYTHIAPETCRVLNETETTGMMKGRG
jgi:hypothetical protein